MSKEYHIRNATIFDANEIARINVHTWKQTYRGLIEQRMLDSLSEEKRREFWFTVIGQAKQNQCILVAALGAEEHKGRLAAYISGGLSRISGFDAEVYALYCDPSLQAKGIGTELLRDFILFARQQQWKSLCVRVLSSNPYKSFYYKHGAQFSHTLLERIGDKDYEEEVAFWTLPH